MDTLGSHDEFAVPGTGVEEDGRDPRRTESLRLLMRTAKLVTPEGEFLCVLRDAASTGFRARIYHRLPAEAAMELELASAHRYPVEKAWEKEGEAGFKFAEPVDLEEIVNELTPFPKRGVRLRICLDTNILIGDDKCEATIYNISQQGARIVTRQPLARAQRLRLEIIGLRTVSAQVRWRDEDTYGLVFDDTFRFDELAKLAHRLQRMYASRSGENASFLRQPRIELP